MAGGNEIVTTTSGGEFKVLPYLEPYIKELGNQLQQLLADPMTNLGRFAHEEPLGLPPWESLNLSPLQKSGMDILGGIVKSGMPTPTAETTAYNWLANLPASVGAVPPSAQWADATSAAKTLAQLSGETLPETSGLAALGRGGAGVPESQRVGAAVDTAAAMAGLSGMSPLEIIAAGGLGRFSGGDLGQSPAIQAAIQGLESNVVPMLQNRAATMGLANSGELLRQIGESYAQQLVPLYQQGMAQQQSAAQELGQLGGQVTQRQLGGLQALRDMQYAAGQNEQALETERLIRQIQTGTSMAGIGGTMAQRQMYGSGNLQNLYQMQAANEQQLQTDALNRLLGGQIQGAQLLGQMSKDQYQRFTDPMRYAFQGGGLQRDIGLEQRGFILEPFLRQRAMSLGAINPGAVSVAAPAPSTTTQKSTSSGTFK